MTEQPAGRWPARVAAAIALGVIAGQAAELFSRIRHGAIWLPQPGYPHDYPAGLACLLTAAGVLALAGGRRVLAAVLGAAVLGVTALAWYVSEIGMLPGDLGDAPPIRSVQFSIATMLGYGALGAALTILPALPRSAALWTALAAAVAGGTGLGIIAALRNLPQVEPAFRWWDPTAPALSTALGMMLLGPLIGLLATRGEPRRREDLVRWLPLTIGVVAMLCSMGIWVSWDTKLLMNQQDYLSNAVQLIRAAVLNRIQDDFDALRAIGDDASVQPGEIALGADGCERAVIEGFLELVVYDAGKGDVIRFPCGGFGDRKEHAAVGADLGAVLERCARFPDGCVTTVAGPGGDTVALLLGVSIGRRGGEPLLLAALAEVRDVLGPPMQAPAPGFALRVDGVGGTLYAAGEPQPGTDDFEVSLPISDHGEGWILHLAPSVEFLRRSRSNLSDVTFWFGLVIPILLSWTVYLRQRSQAQAQRLASTARRLEAEARLRRDALQRLEAAEERMRVAVESSRVGTYDWRLSDGRMMFDAALEHLLGLPPKTFPGRFDDFLRAVHPDDRARLIEEAQDARDARHGFDTEFRVLLPGGLERHLVTQGTVIRDARGEPLRVSGACWDVTENRQAVEALERSERRLQAILDNSTTVIYLKHRDGRYLLVNKRFESLIGRSQADIAGRTDYDLWPAEIADKFASNDHLVAEEGRVIEFEETALDQGVPRSYVSIKFPIRGETGEVLAVGGISTDITARKQAEETIRRRNEELQDLNEELHRINQELDQFAYVASHDLQEPLRTIVTYTGFLREDLGAEVPAEAEEDLRALAAAARRMQALVRDLLAFSRSGRHEMNCEWLDLALCAQGAVANLETAIQESAARVEAGALPTAFVDRVLMTQVFQNLIGNALKFSRDRRPEVQVTARETAEWHILSVADNGIGVPPEYAEQIFAPFKRLHTQREFAGTGIGLAICRKVIERHGGRIGCEPNTPHGTIFRIELPKGHVTL